MQLEELHEKQRKEKAAERQKKQQAAESKTSDLTIFISKYEEDRRKQKKHEKALKKQVDELSSKLQSYASHEYVAQNKEDIHEMVTKQMKQYADDLQKKIDEKYSSLRPYQEPKTETRSRVDVDDAALEEKILRLLEGVIEKKIESQGMAIQQNKSKMDLTEKRMKGIDEAIDAIKNNQLRYDGEDRSYKVRMDRFEHQIKDVRDNLLAKLNSIFGAEHNVEDLVNRYKDIRDDITRRIDEMELKNQGVLQDVVTVKEATKECTEHIQTFTNQYENISKSVTDMESKVTDYQRRVLQNNEDVIKIQQEVKTGLAGMRQEMDAQKSNLDSDLVKVRADVTKFSEIIGQQNSAMEGLEKELQSLEGKIKDLQARPINVERGSVDTAKMTDLRKELEEYVDEKVQDVEARHALDKGKLDGMQAEYVDIYKKIQEVSQECKKDYRSVLEQTGDNNAALRTEFDAKYTKLSFDVNNLQNQLNKNGNQIAARSKATDASPGVVSTDVSAIQREFKGLQTRVIQFEGDLKTIRDTHGKDLEKVKQELMTEMDLRGKEQRGDLQNFCHDSIEDVFEKVYTPYIDNAVRGVDLKFENLKSKVLELVENIKVLYDVLDHRGRVPTPPRPSDDSGEIEEDIQYDGKDESKHMQDELERIQKKIREHTDQMREIRYITNQSELKWDEKFLSLQKDTIGLSTKMTNMDLEMERVSQFRRKQDEFNKEVNAWKTTTDESMRSFKDDLARIEKNVETVPNPIPGNPQGNGMSEDARDWATRKKEMEEYIDKLRETMRMMRETYKTCTETTDMQLEKMQTDVNHNMVLVGFQLESMEKLTTAMQNMNGVMDALQSEIKELKEQRTAAIPSPISRGSNKSGQRSDVTGAWDGSEKGDKLITRVEDVEQRIREFTVSMSNVHTELAEFLEITGELAADIDTLKHGAKVTKERQEGIIKYQTEQDTSIEAIKNDSESLKLRVDGLEEKIEEVKQQHTTSTSNQPDLDAWKGAVLDDARVEAGRVCDGKVAGMETRIHGVEQTVTTTFQLMESHHNLIEKAMDKSTKLEASLENVKEVDARQDKEINALKKRQGELDVQVQEVSNRPLPAPVVPDNSALEAFKDQITKNVERLDTEIKNVSSVANGAFKKIQEKETVLNTLKMEVTGLEGKVTELEKHPVVSHRRSDPGDNGDGKKVDHDEPGRSNEALTPRLRALQADLESATKIFWQYEHGFIR